MRLFRLKKKKAVVHDVVNIDWEVLLSEKDPQEIEEARYALEWFFDGIFKEPETNATIRLTQGANDFGAIRGFKAYNAHKDNVQNWASLAKASKLRAFNQWVNTPQSVNAGFSNAQLSYYLFQVVNYYDCMTQAQDPLMSKVLSILSETPFSKGGEINNMDKKKAEKILQEAEKVCLREKFIAALRSQYALGGCLLYLQTDDEDLSEPLDLTTYDVRKIKDFIHIDPINLAAVYVNTSEPAKADYMQPSMWYVVGLGNVHASRFLKFEDNVPELLMRPLTLYFGTPLTNLIKQDIANSNLATQGLANLINRCRYLFLRTDDQSYTTGNVRQFNARLRVMSKQQDNFMFTPIKTTEEVLQQVTSLAGFAETAEFFYQVISAKTCIPMTELMGTSAKGMDATGEGDRKSWYDRVEVIRQTFIRQWNVALGIIAGQEDGKFKEINYRFNLMDTPTMREAAEINKATLEVAKALIEVGADQKEVFDWLKKNEVLGISAVNFDAEKFEENPFDDTDETETDFSSLNEWDESKHSRGKDGKFGKGGHSSESKSQKETSDVPSEWGKSYSEFSGKPKEAIEKLMSEKSGYVPAAFHKEGIGDIDLVYGEGGPTGYGLAHISEKHGEEILKEIPSVIEKGSVDNKHKKFGRVYIKSDDKKIIVRLDWNGTSKSWLASAFIEEKTP